MESGFEGRMSVNLQSQDGHKRESTRESLYEKIDAKVGMIVDLMDFAERSADLSKEGMQHACNEKLASLSVLFDSETNNACNEIERLTEEGDEESLAVFRHNHEDAALLFDAAKFTVNLYMKRDESITAENLFNSDPENFYRIIRNAFPKRLSSIDSSNSKVIFSNYSVNLILDNETYDDVFKDSSMGSSFVGTAYNVIRDRDGDINRSVIRHEENHCLTEPFVEPLMYHGQLREYFESVTRDQVAIFNGNEKLAEDDNIEKVLDDFRRNVSIIPRYVNENFNELVADIDSLEEGEISTYFSNFISAMISMEHFMYGIENADAKDIMSAGLREAENYFIDCVDKISNIFFVAKKTGMLRKAKGVFILFKAEKINSAEKYIRHCVGEDRYDFYKLLQPLMCRGSYFKNIENIKKERFSEENINDFIDGKNVFAMADFMIKKYVNHSGIESFFRPENIARFAMIVENNEFVLDESERLAIKESVAGSRISSGIKSIDEFLKYTQNVLKIGKHFGIEEFVNAVDELAISFALDNFEYAVEMDDYGELESLLRTFPVAGKYIAIFGGNNIYDWYLKFHHKKHSIDTLRDSNFGKFIEKSGLFDDFKHFFLRNQDKKIKMQRGLQNA